MKCKSRNQRARQGSARRINREAGCARQMQNAQNRKDRQQKRRDSRRAQPVEPLQINGGPRFPSRQNRRGDEKARDDEENFDCVAAVPEKDPVYLVRQCRAEGTFVKPDPQVNVVDHHRENAEPRE